MGNFLDLCRDGKIGGLRTGRSSSSTTPPAFVWLCGERASASAMPYSCPRLTYAPMGRNYPGAVQFLAISAGDIVSCIRDGTAEADALSKRGPDKQRKQPATKP